MNRLLQTSILSIRNLGLHKLRSFLTILGLVFGVASVIVMLAVAEGASAEAQRQIADLGAQNIIIRSAKPVENITQSKSDESVLIYGLTQADLERIRQTIPTIVRTSALREFRRDCRFLERGVECRVLGVETDHFDNARLTIAQGRGFSSTDFALAANVVVLSWDLAAKLFPLQSALGQSVSLGDKHFYRVIGITAPKASYQSVSVMSAAESIDEAFIPASTDKARFGILLYSDKQGTFTLEKLEISQITVSVDKLAHVKPTAAAIESLLFQFHPKRDFSISVPLELLEKAEATKRLFSMVLGSIAGISLVVGGIGIMNIMLATVTERTREIGIRRALGARRGDIVLQFLIETAVLSATGGLNGVLLGMILPNLVERITNMHPIVPGWAAPLAFGIALLTGVCFGVYPARRAAQLDPVEALRME